MKKCSGCGEVRPLVDYYKDKRSTDGLYSRCKSCHKGATDAYYAANKAAAMAAQRQRRSRNPEAAREASRRWARNNPEKSAANSKRWRDNNPEQFAAIAKAYYEANREQILVKAAEWRARTERAPITPEARQRYNAVRRARHLGSFVADVDRDELILRDEGRCGICEKPIMDERLEVDHIVPLSRGGTHEPANCQIAHAMCNRRKSARLDYKAA